MKHNILRTVMTAIALIGGQVHAVPTMYPTEVTKLSLIKNSTNSNLIMDSVDTNRVYVMPPNTAEAKVNGLHTVNANVLYCEDIKTARKFSGGMLERLGRLTDEALVLKSEADEYQKIVFAAREELGKYSESKNLGDLEDLDQRIEAMDSRLTTLRQQLESCSRDCESVKSEAKDLKNEKMALVKDRKELARSRVVEAREYDRRKNAVARAVENYQDHVSSYDSLNARVIRARNDFMNIFAAYGKLEGARAAFSYQGNWDQNLSTLRADNSGFSFEKIKTENVRVYPSIAKIEGLPADGAILSFDLPGQRSEGSIQLTSYPDSLNANIVLSLFGACPMLYPEEYKLENLNGVNGMKYGLAVTYEFPSAFKLQVTAKFNMYKMYQKIVSSGTNGGLFSSSSWSKVEERNEFRDSFTINWLEQDPSNSVSEEERLTIEAALRREIFSRIANLAIPTVVDRQNLLAAAAPGPHGAVVLADALTKTCPTNIYCTGGAIMLNVLDSIFGSSKTTANYTSIQDIESSETWSRDGVRPKSWITIFNPTQNN